jgi:archaeosine synthase
MTKFYEVRKRDGPARIGLLFPSEVKKTQTPAVFRVEALLSGEEGFDVRSVEAANFREFCQQETWHAPRAAVLLPEVHPLVTTVKEAIPSLHVDSFVLSFASALLYSPREFVRRIIAAREAIPPDAALWVPAIATAENAALLIYLGVDLIDDTNAVLSGYQGIYQTEEGALDLSDLEEFPCTCCVCTSCSPDELREKDLKERAALLAQHNTLLLEKEVRKIRAYIRAGNLREYVELKVRSSPFLTAALRILDHENVAYCEKRTPVARSSCMLITTMESLWRIEVKRFARRVAERYEHPPERRILLLLPCSARKPYSISPSHTKFIEAIERYRGHIHEVMLTSPLGVVPRELELVYPAAFYDIPVTGYWDAEERAWVASCLRAYLERHAATYNRIVAHLAGPYRELCSAVAAELNLDVEYTCAAGERETSPEALGRLRECVAALCGVEKRLPGFEQRASTFRAMADYQFGLGVGNELLRRGERERLKITGKFPAQELRVDGTVLARLVPDYGLLVLTLAGARRIRELSSAYTVHIDDFIPKGSILAPGVTGAGDAIRVNDEVIFVGPRAWGVGRAKMSGWEMVASRKGAAVEVREVAALDRGTAAPHKL